ncbi:unnamed protein product [Anisakis simplex]|uniref:Kinesin-like protein n=1 Tax=Anisakis simplex TaxID=6269 RepID=A0A0M3K3J9_ANISI|nr:unnamed protein product [Anisakis simplex]
MTDGESIIVAVRVRPFNERELQRKAQLIIDMPDGQHTSIRNPAVPNEEPKWFTFDHSYWSHDGFIEEENGYFKGVDERYADQRKVFNDLGEGVLDNAWKGYNCSLFAYGQTGSGKSYSMVGYKNNKGIIPIVCEELFNRIDAQSAKNSGTEYQVSISMFEIYCEKVRDLLSDKPPPKGGLKIREHPKNGFYVEDLSVVPVNSYKEIEQKMDEGTKQRTIAATDMNATSSRFNVLVFRAHTIVKIQFNQKSQKPGGGTTTKTSQINLVDLAGRQFSILSLISILLQRVHRTSFSERQKDAASEGDRLKEGIVINQSLSALGRVIKALYEQQGKKRKGISIPYRDSVLTSLLKNALGGNSKTIMIAAISPADLNYEETLSTLRFADRAKSIKTQAIINESATERMIRELKEENARLLEMIQSDKKDPHSLTLLSHEQDEVEALKKQLEENQKEMEQLQKTWQQRLDEQKQKGNMSDERSTISERRLVEPHLWNLNEDPALTDMIVYFIGTGQFEGSESSADIQLNGLNIQAQHATFTNKNNKKVTLTPVNGAEVLVNGKPIHSQVLLQTNDRIFFGGNHLYVFVNPNKKRKDDNVKITYDMAQKEIAKNSGLTAAFANADNENKSPGEKKYRWRDAFDESCLEKAMQISLMKKSVNFPAELILEEDLINLLPNVYRANSMSKELNRNVTFEIVLVAPEARGLIDGLTEIWIKVYEAADDTHFLWEKNRFMNRYYGMQEMYQNFVEGDTDWDVPKERDPFYEPPESDVLIGFSTVYLQSLAYLVEHEEQLPIFDFDGQDLGRLDVAIIPSTTAGKDILGEYVEDPIELVGKNLSFKVRIHAAVGLPRRVDSSFCKYRFFDRPETVTNSVREVNAAYAHETAFTYRPVTKELVNYLKEGSLNITIWGTQKSRKMSQRSSASSPPKRTIVSSDTANDKLVRFVHLHS